MKRTGWNRSNQNIQQKPSNLAITLQNLRLFGKFMHAYVRRWLKMDGRERQHDCICVLESSNDALYVINQQNKNKTTTATPKNDHAK